MQYLVDMNYDYSKMMADGVAYAAVEANQKFLRPLFCGDKISVYWKMVDLTAKSLTIRQAFSKGVETRKSLPADAIIESLVFDATIKLVSVDPKTGRAVDMLKSHFELFNT